MTREQRAREALPVVVVEESDFECFQVRCAKRVAEGYKLSSSSCGFVDSAEYDYCSSYQAVFVLESAALRKAEGGK